MSGPLGDTVEACYGLLPDGGAVVEMAAAAGLPLVQGREDPLNATTRGVGELLLDAAGRGARSILLGLGGSCTNDCGIGMAAALGFRFLDGAGAEVEPLAKNLGRIAEILPPAENRLPPIRAACDVTNPLLGPRGATYTFGPQKGADGPALEALEEGMTSFARVLARYAGVEDVQIPGAGAAGGLGAAVIFLLGGTLTPGAELLLDQAGFDGLLEGADLVITGEGRMDGQSAAGKVPGTGRGCPAWPCAGPWGMEPRFSTARESPPSSAPSGGRRTLPPFRGGRGRTWNFSPKPPSACS